MQFKSTGLLHDLSNCHRMALRLPICPEIVTEKPFKYWRLHNHIFEIEIVETQIEDYSHKPWWSVWEMRRMHHTLPLDHLIHSTSHQFWSNSCNASRIKIGIHNDRQLCTRAIPIRIVYPPISVTVATANIRNTVTLNQFRKRYGTL